MPVGICVYVSVCRSIATRIDVPAARIYEFVVKSTIWSHRKFTILLKHSIIRVVVVLCFYFFIFLLFFLLQFSFIYFWALKVLLGTSLFFPSDIFKSHCRVTAVARMLSFQCIGARGISDWCEKYVNPFPAKTLCLEFGCELWWVRNQWTFSRHAPSTQIL